MNSLHTYRRVMLGMEFPAYVSLDHVGHKTFSTTCRQGFQSLLMGDDVGNSFCNVYVHYVFCTKNREPWIIPDIQDRLWSYMGGIARSHGMKALCIGGYFDHVHALLSLPVTMSICVAIKLIKGGSAKWLNENYAVKGSFSWQEGYAAYSVGRSEAKRIRAYIKRQNEHHSKANIK